jgi:hypothetical protein
MRIEGPVWIESKSTEPEREATLYIQVVSFNEKEMDYESPHHTADIMNAMLTPKDVELIGEKDPSMILPAITAHAWGNLPDYLQESLSELKVFGEDTTVVRRVWLHEDGDVIPVVLNEGQLERLENEE